MRLLWLFLLLLTSQPMIGQQFFVKFPNDTVLYKCPGSQLFGEPEVTGPGAADVQFTYTSHYDNAGGCTLLRRTWILYSPLLPMTCVAVPNPEPDADPNSPINRLGPIMSAPNTPAPWTSTVTNLTPNDPTPTDFSTFWSDNNGCYSYVQLIRIYDDGPPQIANCPANVVYQDSSDNHPDFWHDPNWFDPLSGTDDLPEGTVDLSLTISDKCMAGSVEYRIFMDLDQDGQWETVAPGMGALQQGFVLYNNINSLFWQEGEPRYFDNRNVPEAERYYFNHVLTPINDSTFSAQVVWKVWQQPTTRLPVLPPGNYKIRWTVDDICGNETVCEYLFSVEPAQSSSQQRIAGHVTLDNNYNCLFDSGEAPVYRGWKSRLEQLSGNNNTTIYKVIQPDGSYQFLVDSGTYRLSLVPPNDYWNNCIQDSLLQINTTGGTTPVDFSVQTATDCPFLETDIGTWGLRRCFENTYTVRYCNMGTQAAENAYITVALDSFLTYVSSPIPGQPLGGNVWKFDLGTIPPGFCDHFPLTVHLSCDAQLGQTHCVEAHIYPDSICLPTTNWSGADVSVGGNCQTDSVRFVLKNKSNAATSLLEYVIIEDNIINRQGVFQLGALDSMVIKIPANGSTWRLEAGQEPGNPTQPRPSASVEACGTNAQGTFSVGFISQFAEPDNDPFISVDCHANVGSYDPNDKRGYPLGFGLDNRINLGQPIDYIIRFQNTGTDTAFRVVVRDTLSPWLDPATVQPGASSHPYTFEMGNDGALSFSFKPIALPDSNVNEPASHGFIKFRVQQRPNTPLNKTILNQAAIYFDFNAPVITNQTVHRTGENFVPVDTREAVRAVPRVVLSPNPATLGHTLRLPAGTWHQCWFDLSDIQGRLVFSAQISGDEVRLPKENLSEGLYFFKIRKQGQCQGVGKVALTGQGE